MIVKSSSPTMAFYDFEQTLNRLEWIERRQIWNWEHWVALPNCWHVGSLFWSTGTIGNVRESFTLVYISIYSSYYIYTYIYTQSIHQTTWQLLPGFSGNLSQSRGQRVYFSSTQATPMFVNPSDGSNLQGGGWASVVKCAWKHPKIFQHSFKNISIYI